MNTFKCEYCGKEFEGREGQRFCSTECRNAYNYRLRKYGKVTDIPDFTVNDEPQAQDTDNEPEDAEDDFPKSFTDRETKIIARILSYVADYTVNQDLHAFCVNMVKDFPIAQVYKFSVLMGKE